MHRYFLIVLGNWKLENWHVYRQRRHYSAKQPAVSWLMWDRVL